MKVYFDPVSMGFYTTEYFKTFPVNSVEISSDLYEELLSGESQGLQISCGEGGTPFLKEPEVDLEFLVIQENAWVKEELSFASDELEKVQDSDTKATGTVAQWREYRKALRSWPEHKDFPNKESRPVSPLIKEY